ncbi:MAG TPA: VWA domain-containing protein [Polyangiales bacterium]
MSARFPFSAVVGQDEAKLALLLAAASPALGGVLLRGDKGSAKSTLARGLAALLPGDGPFVELPLGATEDRAIGSVELGSLLHGQPRVRMGLLANAHGGVLYVDEINLLADHLVDVLLDVAVSGVNRIERDGVSHAHPARFVLIGSMNPEEGELRPQLLDRFGFCVDVQAPSAAEERAEIVQRRLDYERDPRSVEGFYAADLALKQRLAQLRPAHVQPEVIALCARVALAVGAEGLRADLMLCRGAAAHAAWQGREQANAEDVHAVARFVLGHRRRRAPLDPPSMDPREIEQALANAADPTPEHGSEPPTQGQTQRTDAPGSSVAPPQLSVDRAQSALSGKRSHAEATHGRFVRAARVDERTPSGASLAAVATLQAVAERRAQEPDAALSASDLRVAVRAKKSGHLVILCVDASGSMGAEQRMALAKGAVLGLLTDAYQRRDRIALVTFAGERADVVLRPTASIEIAQARLRDLPTGGTSPIAEGLDAALQLARGTSGDQNVSPLLILITDGRATGGKDALARGLASAQRIAHEQIPAVVIDVERGTTRLGLAAELAAALGAPCLGLDQLADGSLERTIRLRLGA